jgi:hypothetical protein
MHTFILKIFSPKSDRIDYRMEDEKGAEDWEELKVSFLR